MSIGYTQSKVRGHKIMTQPLPAILDYIDEKIRELEEATRKAEVATGEARVAAEEARVAGEKAAGEARIAGEKASAEVAKEAREAITAVEKALAREMAEVRKIAEEAWRFARLLNQAQVEGLNANIRAFNSKMAEWK